MSVNPLSPQAALEQVLTSPKVQGQLESHLVARYHPTDTTGDRIGAAFRRFADLLVTHHRSDAINELARETAAILGDGADLQLIRKLAEEKFDQLEGKYKPAEKRVESEPVLKQIEAWLQKKQIIPDDVAGELLKIYGRQPHERNSFYKQNLSKLSDHDKNVLSQLFKNKDNFDSVSRLARILFPSLGTEPRKRNELFNDLVANFEEILPESQLQESLDVLLLDPSVECEMKALIEEGMPEVAALVFRDHRMQKIPQYSDPEFVKYEKKMIDRAAETKIEEMTHELGIRPASQDEIIDAVNAAAKDLHEELQKPLAARELSGIFRDLNDFFGAGHSEHAIARIMQRAEEKLPKQHYHSLPRSLRQKVGRQLFEAAQAKFAELEKAYVPPPAPTSRSIPDSEFTKKMEREMMDFGLKDQAKRLLLYEEEDREASDFVFNTLYFRCIPPYSSREYISQAKELITNFTRDVIPSLNKAIPNDIGNSITFNLNKQIFLLLLDGKDREAFDVFVETISKAMLKKYDIENPAVRIDAAAALFISNLKRQMHEIDPTIVQDIQKVGTAKELYGRVLVTQDDIRTKNVEVYLNGHSDLKNLIKKLQQGSLDRQFVVDLLVDFCCQEVPGIEEFVEKLLGTRIVPSRV